MGKYCIGLDFGTESVRVVVADERDGRFVAEETRKYPHGVIDERLPGTLARLDADWAFQDPDDWLAAAGSACRAAVRRARISADDVVGIGVDFTSCTMMPALRDGTPLCRVPNFRGQPMAWPKLWKHHGAKEQTDRINEIARKRGEEWLSRYGGIVGLEWFFPKMLETAERSPKAFDAAEVWLEGGDWLVWQLTTGPYPACRPEDLVRSNCQAGYKGLWSRRDGFPSRDYLKAVNPKLADVVERAMPGEVRSPGTSAGRLSAAAAKLLGLREGIAVSTAIIDAHAGVIGSGVAEDGTLVMVIGTSSCHMLNSRTAKRVPGVAGVVEDGILPGYFGYETGQASVGDALAWVVEATGRSHEGLSREAAKLPPGSGGVLAIDWLNGCRTPLMDGRLSGGFVGLTLGTTPAQLYRAMIEATAFGVRWIVQTLRDAGVPVRRFVASGGLPAKSPLLMQIYADVLGVKIELAESTQSVALGAAILGALAAQGRSDPAHVSRTVRRMARPRKDLAYRPSKAAHTKYDELYRMYRSVSECNGPLARTMRDLRAM